MCLWHVEDASVKGYFEIIFSVVAETNRWRQVRSVIRQVYSKFTKKYFTTNKNTKAYHVLKNERLVSFYGALPPPPGMFTTSWFSYVWVSYTNHGWKFFERNLIEFDESYFVFDGGYQSGTRILASLCLHCKKKEDENVLQWRQGRFTLLCTHYCSPLSFSMRGESGSWSSIGLSGRGESGSVSMCLRIGLFGREPLWSSSGWWCFRIGLSGRDG